MCLRPLKVGVPRTEVIEVKVASLSIEFDIAILEKIAGATHIAEGRDTFAIKVETYH